MEVVGIVGAFCISLFDGPPNRMIAPSLRLAFFLVGFQEVGAAFVLRSAEEFLDAFPICVGDVPWHPPTVTVVCA